MLQIIIGMISYDGVNNETTMASAYVANSVDEQNY